MLKISPFKKSISLKLLSLFVLCLMYCNIPLVEAEQVLNLTKSTATFERGEKYQQGNAKVINLYGTWHKMGRQYGHLLKAELNDVYTTKIKAFMDKHPEQIAKIESIANNVYQRNPYKFRSIMQGMSETSGLTLQQIKMTNSVEHFSGITQCSGLAVWQDYSKDGLVYGRNYDFFPSFKKLSSDVIVAVFHPADGSLAAATIGYCGEIYAVNGLNEAGIFLELNNGSPSGIKRANERIHSTASLFNLLFDADSLQYTDAFFDTVQSNSAYLIGVANGQTARSYEWDVEGVKHGETTTPNGIMAMCNHYSCPAWNRSLPTNEKSWNSLSRRQNLLELATVSKGQIDVNNMQRIMSLPIEQGGPFSNDLTVYQMVVTPGNQQLWLRIVNGQDWIKLDLKKLLQKKSYSQFDQKAA